MLACECVDYSKTVQLDARAGRIDAEENEDNLAIKGSLAMHTNLSKYS